MEPNTAPAPPPIIPPTSAAIDAFADWVPMTTSDIAMPITTDLLTLVIFISLHPLDYVKLPSRKVIKL
jgi:hypothetical protein